MSQSTSKQNKQFNKQNRKQKSSPKTGQKQPYQQRGNERTEPVAKNTKAPNKNQSQLLTGIIKRHPDGFGFFISENLSDPDIYVPRQNMSGVMTNDKVKVKIFPDKSYRGEQRWRGEVAEILTRAVARVVGVFHETNGNEGALFDDSFSWGENLAIAAKDCGGARAGQLVAVDITEYPGERKKFSGRVSYVIGDGGDPLTDVQRVVLSNSIPHEFTKATQAYCAKFATEVKPEEFPERKDLRDRSFITIDGKTAKDFDDAIYVEKDHRGFLLWVAIADVSHYVKPGTQLDDEAYERGTSVYFPGTVVPMLPEVLSNELCSLKPDVPRLVLVCEMQIGFSGEISGYKFHEGIIRSQARVTYGEAQQVIDGDSPEKLKHVEKMILSAADLAKLLMTRRFREGSLDLEIPETEVLVNEKGIPVDVVRAERIFAHRLIEELMLVANICAARFFSANDLPGIYRIHEPPDKEAIEILEKFLHNFGSQAKIMGGKLQKKLSRALADFSGKPEAQILNMLTLRSMSQAKYSAENVGHFGLGFDDYAHFTSPIRRYPDLIVHRVIKSKIVKRDYPQVSSAKLESSAVFLSACEQRSVKAERQVQAIKKARFMEKFVGEQFEGVISSVAKFGVFVLLRKYDVDGRVAVENLGDERWEFNSENLSLRGQRSGHVYAIGDTLTIVVSRVDVFEGKIDFVLYSENAVADGVEGAAEGKGERKLATTQSGKTNRPDHKERFKTEKDSRRSRSSRFPKRRRKA